MEFILNYEGEEINELLGKAKTALQSVPSEYVTETELNNKGYLTEHQDISHLATKVEVADKQDAIADLDTIRAGASRGATALQSIPEEYVTNAELDQKQDAIEDLEQIRENASKVSTILGEDGYVYSNGEKVDMRFTRSLLPVGTSIPAKANLNSKTYLKIGKYYCSLNVDAKTITNCPTSEAFSMEVFNPLGTNVDDEDTREYTYRLRVLTAYKTGVQYIQYCATSGTPGSWTYNGWFVVPRTSFSLASSKNGGTAAKGASNRGVYIDSTGTFQQMGYTVAKSVPSNAIFTDTNTKVTSVANHYAPAENTDSELSAPDGEVVVGIKRDAAGHVVGVSTAPNVASSALSADWNASEGEDGYILNRTHYTSESTIEDLSPYDEGNSYNIPLDQSDIDEFTIEVYNDFTGNNETFSIQGIKNTSYPLIEDENANEYYYANVDFITSGEQVEMVLSSNSDYLCFRKVTIKCVKTLDDKFIPDTIVRQSDLLEAIATSITNVLNTPV